MEQHDLALSDKEVPLDFMIEKKFMLVDEYFKHERYPMPAIMKKRAEESELSHRERVKQLLLAFDSKTFTEISFIINPDNHFE